MWNGLKQAYGQKTGSISLLSSTFSFRKQGVSRYCHQHSHSEDREYLAIVVNILIQVVACEYSPKKGHFRWSLIKSEEPEMNFKE